MRFTPAPRSLSAFASGILFVMSAPGASAQSGLLWDRLGDVRIHMAFPVSSIRDRRRDTFNRLTAEWRSDTRFLSSPSQIAMHPAYQAIIGMGPDALPLIFKHLRSHGGQWFWALSAISNEDPVRPSERGRIAEMRAAWLRWADKKGIRISDDAQ